MNLKTSLLLAGGVATGVIALAAAVVFTGSKPIAAPEAPRLSVAAVEAEKPLPDPAASGVIIATSGNYYYWLKPAGGVGTLTQWAYPQNGVSTDGRWQAGIDWQDDKAFLRVFDLDNPNSPENVQSIHLSGSLTGAEWAPEASMLAAMDESGLYLVDPVTGEASLVAEGVTAYTWGAGDRLIYATLDDSGARLSGLDERGRAAKLAALTGPIDRFYVSPERDQIVYTQDDPYGWRLLSVAPEGGAVVDYGHLGLVSNKTIARVLEEAPELAVAWSPDGSLFAVGPVSQPYAMYLVQRAEGWGQPVSSFFFEEGYAGELSWSPDGTQLAISTYSLDRTRHEVYVMDVAAGSAPRHLLDGCKIVWSPDGQFVAVKREPHDASGVAAIRVDTGFHWALNTNPQFVPVVWGEDMEDALTLAAKPVPYAVQLGK
jgi:WD40-like Beta Propeller Repeat